MLGSALGSAPCSEGVPPVSRSGAPPAAGSPASALSGDRRPRRARGRHATPSAHSLTRVLAQQGNIANDSQARFYESWSRRGNELNEWKQRGRGWRSGEGSETLSVLCSGGRASVVRCRCPGRSAVLSAGCRGSRGGRGLQTRCAALSEAPRQPGRLGSPCLRCSSQLADLGTGGEGKEGRSPPTHTHTLPHLSQSLGTEPHLAAGEAWRWAQCRAAPALTLRPHQRGGCLLGQGSETLLPHPPTTQRTCRPPRPAWGWSPPSMDGVEGRMWREMQITSAWPLQPLASPLGCQPTSLPLSAVLVAPSSVAPVLVPEGLREPLQ